MSFTCPACFAPAALEITRAMDFPADARSDDITLQIVICSACGFQGIAVYEESRRGALDAEAVDHRGYRVEAGRLRTLIALMGQCPRPRDGDCQCAAHAALGRTQGGYWRGLDEVETLGSFPMRLATP